METEDTKPGKNKGGRPRKPVDTRTPEFREAVAAAISEALPMAVNAAIPTIVAKARAEGVLPQEEGEDTFRRLALAIAEVSDQGTGRKRIAPEISERRRLARDKMLATLDRNHKQGWPEGKPDYCVIAKTYLADRVVEPFHNGNNMEIKRVVVTWDGEPNECLIPVNDIATEIHNLFMLSIGGMTVVEKAGSKEAALDNRGYSVTRGGLVVKGAPASMKREVAGLPDSNVPAGMLERVRQNSSAIDPTAREVSVLGTIHPKAKQANAELMSR